MQVLAFAATNSRNSINKKLLQLVLQKLNTSNVKLLDLNDFPLPIYGIDLENEYGIPAKAVEFGVEIEKADVIIVALAEHNGSYTAVFKNLLDWLSRKKSKCFEEKKMLLLATSPGARGGRGVMDAALGRFPNHGATIVGHFCLPKFNENFHDTQGIIDYDLNIDLEQVIQILKEN
jgi:NAD(P)H-dependent FMN reductase